MFRNKILERIKRGGKALGLFMSDPSEELVEMAGRMGLDFVGFDGQHSPLTPERVGTLCTIADGFDVTPTMRVPDGNESTLLSYLDRGGRGITVPNNQTREEAEKLVKIESVNVFWNVKGALEQLLESHGRRSRMTW